MAKRLSRWSPRAPTSGPGTSEPTASRSAGRDGHQCLWGRVDRQTARLWRPAAPARRPASLDDGSARFLLQPPTAGRRVETTRNGGQSTLRSRSRPRRSRQWSTTSHRPKAHATRAGGCVGTNCHLGLAPLAGEKSGPQARQIRNNVSRRIRDWIRLATRDWPLLNCTS